MVVVENSPTPRENFLISDVGHEEVLVYNHNIPILALDIVLVIGHLFNVEGALRVCTDV